MVEKYSISILYTAPTAIRGLMRFGDAWPNRHDLSSLRLLGSVGEPINPEAWKWYHTVIGKENCPIMDTWWQTETGGFMISPLPITLQFIMFIYAGVALYLAFVLEEKGRKRIFAVLVVLIIGHLTAWKPWKPSTW